MGLLGVITSPIIGGIGAVLGAGSQNISTAQAPNTPKAPPAVTTPETPPESTSQQGVIIETILKDAQATAVAVETVAPVEDVETTKATKTAEMAPETLHDAIVEDIAKADTEASVVSHASGAGIDGVSVVSAAPAPAASATDVSRSVDSVTEEDAARAAAEASTLAARKAGVLERLRSDAPVPTAAQHDAPSSDAAAAQQAYGATSLMIISPVATTGPRALQAAL